MLAFYFVAELREKWTGGSALDLNRENERFTVGFSRGRKTLNLGISHRRLVDYVKEFYRSACLPHVQHDYFSSFVQSDHCFLALFVLLPSSLLKLDNHSLCIAYYYSQNWKMPINWNGTDIHVLNSL